MGLGTWGACGLGFENSSVLLGNLSIACCGINGGLGLKSVLMLGNAVMRRSIEWIVGWLLGVAVISGIACCGISGGLDLMSVLMLGNAVIAASRLNGRRLAARFCRIRGSAVGIGDSERESSWEERRHPLAKCLARLCLVSAHHFRGNLESVANALRALRPRCRLGCGLLVGVGFGYAAMVYELWYGCVCLRAPCLGIELLRSLPLGALLRGPCVSRRLGFLCCIPNVMELVASGVPFLLCKTRGGRQNGSVPAAIENYFVAPAVLVCLLVPGSRNRVGVGFHGL
ncbi:hypothetical protein FNV43_RR20966 [Rhamnella rubrinervis]|uniref:Uncharacterized protein n=1 Tax=Rhamnella rubrinervis TaxID=2594499 RepID=A0A8K0GUN8_9ROSA|nr:hypothetical protein FNV43_RR20966 [Rhamnella rubrinervis]